VRNVFIDETSQECIAKMTKRGMTLPSPARVKRNCDQTNLSLAVAFALIAGKHRDSHRNAWLKN
jgi:hypothetical protein